MNWALSQNTGSPAAKSVLLILANRADHNGICWPGFGGICKQTELSRRAVIDNIKRLEADGFLTIKNRPQPLTNLYRLNIHGGAVDALVQEVHGAGGALEVVQEVHWGSAGGAPEPSLTQSKPKESTPEGLNEDAWQDYQKHRSEIKARKLTVRGQELAMKKLAVLTKDQQQSVVDLSISNGWTGLFPEKANEKAKRSDSFDDKLARVRARAGLS